MTRPLKDLEAYILGVIGEFQPCTPYKVMKFFLESPSVYYSGSAGAIYPAITRLEERGLVTSAPSGTEGKKSKEVSLTPQGKASFEDWFEDQLLIADGGFDPLRGRISLLSAFSEDARPKKLEALLKAAESRLKIMEEVKGRFEKTHPYFKSVEMEAATLSAKVNLLKSWLSE